MKRYFTKTFFKFLVGFVAIITLAFGLMVVTSYIGVPKVDNVAHPK